MVSIVLFLELIKEYFNTRMHLKKQYGTVVMTYCRFLMGEFI